VEDDPGTLASVISVAVVRAGSQLGHELAVGFEEEHVLSP
jgi:hypothetical protein